MRKLMSVALAGVLLLTLGGTAFAAKGGSHAGATSSGSIVVPDGFFGGTTAATVNGSASWVHASCSQFGMEVYGQYVAVSGGSATFTLGPTPLWPSGAASCTADAGDWSANGRWQSAYSTTFSTSAN